jgi:hypothetical protein
MQYRPSGLFAIAPPIEAIHYICRDNLFPLVLFGCSCSRRTIWCLLQHFVSATKKDTQKEAEQLKNYVK